ncbi:hypothetical protein BGP_2448 [Beggiatoa sp. PS]|nr:hypothetical protein BGP_2448 [Beggiatoa sp. PS]
MKLRSSLCEIIKKRQPKPIELIGWFYDLAQQRTKFRCDVFKIFYTSFSCTQHDNQLNSKICYIQTKNIIS